MAGNHFSPGPKAPSLLSARGQQEFLAAAVTNTKGAHTAPDHHEAATTREKPASKIVHCGSTESVVTGLPMGRAAFQAFGSHSRLWSREGWSHFAKLCSLFAAGLEVTQETSPQLSDLGVRINFWSFVCSFLNKRLHPPRLCGDPAPVVGSRRAPRAAAGVPLQPPGQGLPFPGKPNSPMAALVTGL